jgi:hypothetical protein
VHAPPSFLPLSHTVDRGTVGAGAVQALPRGSALLTPRTTPAGAVPSEPHHRSHPLSWLRWRSSLLAMVPRRCSAPRVATCSASSGWRRATRCIASDDARDGEPACDSARCTRSASRRRLCCRKTWSTALPSERQVAIAVSWAAAPRVSTSRAPGGSGWDPWCAARRARSAAVRAWSRCSRRAAAACQGPADVIACGSADLIRGGTLIAYSRSARHVRVGRPDPHAALALDGRRLLGGFL